MKDTLITLMNRDKEDNGIENDYYINEPRQRR
jgi:hypothetical protein